MQHTNIYMSPLGTILLACDDMGLTGLWFEGQKYYADGLDRKPVQEAWTDAPHLAEARRWLDVYFSGREPDFTPPLHMMGTTFQMTIWKRLLAIPYGGTITYGDIAKELAVQRGLVHMSAQAVGNAVGRNRISIIVPCHRVVGSNKSLTGYAGGVERKMWLLASEGINVDLFSVPS